MSIDILAQLVKTQGLIFFIVNKRCMYARA